MCKIEVHTCFEISKNNEIKIINSVISIKDVAAKSTLTDQFSTEKLFCKVAEKRSDLYALNISILLTGKGIN